MDIAPETSSNLPRTVFLTEANQEIDIPQGLDDHPEYESMLKKQLKSERIMTFTGLDHNGEHDGKNDWRDVYMKNYSELQRLKSLQYREQMNEKYQKEMLLKEQLALKEEIFLKRMHDKAFSKINFTPDDPKYSKSPFFPGFYFFEALLKNVKTTSCRLKINFPQAFYILESQSYWIYTDETTGILMNSQEYTKMQAYEELKHFYYEPLNVAAVLRRKKELIELESNALSQMELHDKLLKNALVSGAMIQRYIKCNNDRPTITRLFYINTTKVTKASHAYCISSSLSSYEKFSQAKVCLCTGILNGFDISLMHGMAIAEYQKYAKNIVTFLQISHSVRIEEIVLDFVKDQSGKIWFLECKGFNLDYNSAITKEIKLKLKSSKSQPLLKEYLEETKDQLLSSIHCRLCLLPFKNSDLSHSLPFKMLLLYKRHIRKQGRKGLKISHIRTLSSDFLSHSVRICKLCYMLILQEYELIEAENKLAEYLNVDVEFEDLSKKLDYKHPPFLPNKVYQWRVLLYFKSLELLSRQMSFRNKTFYIHFKFFDKAFYFKLQNQDSDMVNLSNLHLIYFYASDNNHVRLLSESENLQILVSDDISGNKIIAAGSTKALGLFSCEMGINDSLTQMKSTTLFNKAKAVININFITGLVCDHMMNLKTLPIDIIKYNSVYLPGSSYFSSDALPDSWMEIFEENYKEEDSSKLLNTSAEISGFYTPTIPEKLIYNMPIQTLKKYATLEAKSPKESPKNSPTISKIPIRPLSSKKPPSEKAGATLRSSISARSIISTRPTSSTKVIRTENPLSSPLLVHKRPTTALSVRNNIDLAIHSFEDEPDDRKEALPEDFLFKTVSSYLTQRGFHKRVESCLSQNTQATTKANSQESTKKRKIARKKKTKASSLAIQKPSEDKNELLCDIYAPHEWRAYKKYKTYEK
ncbi:unnamed protein product [Blepharisma stoltei]|uniref:Little elongation complex subunit 2 C-terminal domain-containing protein n=1 Tax=Blepharisma stoltei TaxID=1481888 RepID=A0AAU9JNU7_9CILI|nr:unnamed protein product [Blepharisma stoltei]